MYNFLFEKDVNLRKQLATYDQLLKLHKELLTTVGGVTFLSKVELARRTGIAEHTIKRRIEELREKIGTDKLIYCHATHGYYYPQPVPAPIDCPLTHEEQNAIALLNEVVGAFRNTPFDAAMRNALKQVQGIAPDIPTVFTQEGPMYFCLPQSSLVDDSNIARHFNPIIKAIKEASIIEISYYEQRSKKEFRLPPSRTISSAGRETGTCTPIVPN